MYYARRVEERFIAWTDEAKARIAKAEILLAEVVEVLTAPDHQRYDHWRGSEMVIVVAMASTGRVISVTCTRTDESPVFHIQRARVLGPLDRAEWERRMS